MFNFLNNQLFSAVEKKIHTAVTLPFIVIFSKNKNKQQNVRLSFMKIFDVVVKHIIFYPTSGSLSYLWGFGSLAGLMLAIQLITGIILAMHFQPSASLAFESVLRIVNDVPNGWCLRSIHANGASFFFFNCIYSYWPWFILWFFIRPSRLDLDYRLSYFFINDGYWLYWLLFTMGSNEFMGGYGYY